jgi:hypothetical protein
MPTPEANQQDQWLDITDFSAGAFNNDATVAPYTDRAYPAPPGSHDPANTYACIALRDGGLGALPGVTQEWTYPGGINLNGPTFVTGLLIHDELSGPNAGTEAIVMAEYDYNTAAPPYKRFMNVGSFILETNNYNLIVATNPATTYTSPPGIFGSPYPEMTRMSASNPATAPFIPVVVWPSGGPAQASPAIGQIYVYPNVPAYPTAAFTADTLISGSSSIAGQLIAHQGRIIVMAANTYTWPGTLMVFNTNDNINFTDPANTISYGNQLEILVPEQPFGYGGGGSQSAGELFLIKKRNGGLIVSGDVSNPSITFLPGVTSTGDIFGRAASTPVGIVYGSFDNGFWSWNGGNTSTKLSPQLDDHFFVPPEFDGTQGYPNMGSNNYGYYAYAYGDRVYVSNNWLYDTTLNSWWKYYPDKSQGGVNLFWIQPVNGNYIYAAVLSFPYTNTTFLYRFDPSVPAQTYQWTSTPLFLTQQSRDRRIDIREVVVRASCSSASVEITLTIADQGNVTFNETQSGFVTNGPELIRWNGGGTQLQSPQIQLYVNNTGATADMPIIHSIHVRYKERAHTASTN